MPTTMILAAGLGSRLRPLTESVPKPILPLGDSSLLDCLVQRRDGTIRMPLVLNACHRAEAIAAELVRLNLDAKVSLEPYILGTGGGIRRALPLLGTGPFLVHNGDVLASYEEAPLLEAAVGVGVALLVAPRPKGEGTVGVDAANRVVRLRNERFGQEQAGGDYVGVAALGDPFLERLPEEGCLVGDAILPHLRHGGTVRSVEYRGRWRDVGTLPSYLAANLDWLERQHSATGSFIAESAHVDDAVHLDRSIVGRGAEVVGRGSLERVVVWPAARAVAPLQDAIVMSDGQVVDVDTNQR